MVGEFATEARDDKIARPPAEAQAGDLGAFEQVVKVVTEKIVD